MAAGSRSFLFPAIWSFAPGMQSLRIWPRMTIILLMPIALLISLAWEGISSARVPDRLVQRSAWRIALVIVALQVVLWTTRTYNSYHGRYFAFMQPGYFLFATLAAAVFVSVWAFHRFKAKFAWALVALMVTASDTGTYGLQIWREGVGILPPTESLDLSGYYRHFFTTPRPHGKGMTIPYTPTSGLITNWWYKSYVAFVNQYKGKAGFAEFLGSGGRKLFFSPTLDAPPEGFEQWWHDLAASDTPSNVSIVPGPDYNGNELDVSYSTTRPGFLIFVDNTDPDWRATVNGSSVPIQAAFGTFKAVPVHAGRGTVTFKYSPSLPYKKIALLGVLIGIGVLVLEIRRQRRLPVDQEPSEDPPITTSS
jgi:hypothetical protein